MDIRRKKELLKCINIDALKWVLYLIAVKKRREAFWASLQIQKQTSTVPL